MELSVIGLFVIIKYRLCINYSHKIHLISLNFAGYLLDERPDLMNNLIMSDEARFHMTLSLHIVSYGRT